MWKGQLLGHTININGIKMVGDNVKAILQVKIPKSVGEVSFFLGYANFRGRFV